MPFRLRPLWLLILYFLCLSGVNSQNNSSCSGTVVLNATKEAQYLTTPDYATSYQYPPFLDCRFLIKAPDKSRIFIEIIDMEMEPRIFEDCSDYVGFFEEVPEKNITRMTTICEELRKRQFLSDSNEITIIFHSDEIFQYRGAQLKFNYFELTSCPPGWTELSDQNCVKLETDQKTDWITAQRRCLEQQSNLVMFKSNDKVIELENLFKSVPIKLWVGNNDAVTEGKLVDLENKDAPHLTRAGYTSSSLTDNNEDNDCQILQFGEDEEFRMDSCAAFNGYICEMKKDGTSELYPPLVQEIQEGSNTRTSQYTLWLLMFLIGILFLTIAAFLCYICWKQKEGGRVHTESATIHQNAFMSDSSQRVERGSATGGQNSAPVPNDVNRTSRSSQVAVAMENNRPPQKKFPVAPVPNRLPMSEENSGSEPVVETGILSVESKEEDEEVETVSAAPKPQPRTLPPMPTREGTQHSIMTKDGSTMRTQRRKELFERPVMNVLDNVSAISLDEFWSNKKP